MNCPHDQIREISTRCYAHPVSVHDENRAAHGGVCITEECVRCGRRRSRNENQGHQEIGPWGASRAERQERASRARLDLDRLLRGRPEPVTLYSQPTGQPTELSIDAEGYIVSYGHGHPAGHEIEAVAPKLWAYSRRVRRARIAADEATAGAS